MFVRRILAATALVAAAALTAACGTHTAGNASVHGAATGSSPSSATTAPASPSLSPAPSSPAPPSSTTPAAPGSGSSVVVTVSAGQSANSVRLRIGQLLVIKVSSGVVVSGLSGTCSTAGSGTRTGALAATCSPTAGTTFRAVHAGSVNLNFTVRPDCKGQTMCPDWIRAGHLAVSVS